MWLTQDANEFRDLVTPLLENKNYAKLLSLKSVRILSN